MYNVISGVSGSILTPYRLPTSRLTPSAPILSYPVFTSGIFIFFFFLLYIFQIHLLAEMNFLRNRLVILGLVLSATVLLYLLLPSIRHGGMEPSLDVQKMGLAAASPPPAPAVNMSIRTGQLPGDPPLFFREALPIDASGRQILPR